MTPLPKFVVFLRFHAKASLPPDITVSRMPRAGSQSRDMNVEHNVTREMQTWHLLQNSSCECTCTCLNRWIESAAEFLAPEILV